MYICKLCNYSTKDNSNFNHHKKTTKHIKNSNAQKLAKNPTISEKTVEKKSYTCSLCNSIYMSKYNLNRHITDFCKVLREKVGKVGKSPNAPVKKGNKISVFTKCLISAISDGDFTRMSDRHMDILKEFKIIKKIGLNKGKTCPFCDKTFCEKRNMCRHLKKCVSIDTFELRYKDRMIGKKRAKKLEQYALSAKQDILLAKKEVSVYKDTTDKMSTALVNNSNNASVSKIAEISNKFPDAEPLKILSCEDYMKNVIINDIPMRPYMDFEQQFVEAILSAQKNKTIVKFLSDTLINMYAKPTSPNNQSVWCTDTSRLRYVVMRNVDKRSNWMSDPGGTYTKEKIIDPLMENINDLLDKYDSHYYWRKYVRWLKRKYPDDESMHIPDAEYQERYTRYQVDSGKLYNDIKGGKLQKKILAHMSTHLNYDSGAIKDK